MDIKELLGERDEKLLDFLYQFKVATVDDVRELIFDSVVKSRVYRRLKELVVMGLIQKVPYQKNGRWLSAYSLTRKSFKKIVMEGENSKGWQQVLSGKVVHDLSLVLIYRRFIKSPEIIDFMTENALLGNSSELSSYGIEEWMKHHPDGILVDQTPKGTFFLPLECELSLKKCFRYETKLIHYYQSTKIPAIIYVCGDAKIRDSLCRIEEKYCPSYRPKVFYGLLSQFQLNQPLTFGNRKGGQLQF